MSGAEGPSVRHPFGGAIYRLMADGNVRVSGDSGEGLFRADGRWISGTLRESDPQMCVWIANQSPPADQLESTWALSQEDKQDQ